MDGGLDHRQHPGLGHTRYWVNDPVALQTVFTRLTGSAPASDQPILLGDRPLRVVRSSAAVLWLRFGDLCDQWFSAVDFIALCDRFPVLLLGNVPALSAPQQSARIARGTEDGVERVVAGDRAVGEASHKEQQR